MDALIRDVWHDLREKRLWPVAVLLIAGLVAVPLVLMKPAESPPPPAAATAVPADAPELATMTALGIEATGGPQGRGSSLDSFEPRNPFKPAASVLASADSELQSMTEVADSTTATAPVSPTGASSGFDAGTESLSGGGPDFGGTPDFGGGGEPGGGTPAPDPDFRPEPAPDEAPEPEPVTYAVDVNFAGPEQSRQVRGLPRLAALPHASVPLLIFLGVSDGGEEAMFLIDSKLRADQGEGTCRPSPERCATLGLEPGERQTFVDSEGRSYLLQLDQIRAVSVEQAIRRRRAADAQAAAAESAPRQFLPVLVDVLTGG